MKHADLWKLSLRSIFSVPVRSLLTVLGMAIGIGAILAVLTLGEAGRDQVRAEMDRLGIDKVWLTAAEGMTLDRGDAQLLMRYMDAEATEQIYLTAEAGSFQKEQSAFVVGCTQSFLEMAQMSLCEGRLLYPIEWRSGNRQVLVGQKLAQSLDVSAGDMLFVEGRVFCVCGIMSAGNGFSRVDTEQAVFLPIDVLCEIAGNTVHEITLDVPEGSMPHKAAEKAKAILEKERNIAVEALTMQVQIEAADSVVQVFVEVLKWVAFICILVGGIGVMNILLISVRERRREIGIMKSLGMVQWQICLLFLIEALIYAVIGGMLGLLIGISLIQMAGQSIGLHPVIRLADCLGVGATALAIGLFFGVAPALKASRLKPVDALRNE